MKNNKGIASIVIILIVVGALALGGYYYWSKNSQKQVVCTEEANICPDGSSVGRTGPNCEFAACPTHENENLQEITINTTYFLKNSFNIEDKTFSAETLDGGKTSGKTKTYKIIVTDKTKIYNYIKNKNDTFSEFAEAMINYKNDAVNTEDPNLIWIYGGYTIKGVLISESMIEASEIFSTVGNQ